VVACSLVGIGYGAVCGAAVGSLAGLLGSLVGGVLGGAGGLGAGVLGRWVGGPAGWGFAGLVGGYLAGCGLVLAFEGWLWLPEIAALPLIPGGIGAAVGIGVGRGLRRGQSPLPGVTELAGVLARTRAPVEAQEQPALPKEVAPAEAPAGRGDEPAAAGE
jgi:hypothetical protein